MGKPPMQLSGLNQVQTLLKKYGKKYPLATAHAMYTEMHEVEAEATRRAPVEFSVLRTSAYTVPPTSKSLTTETGFGTEYAARQHEEVTWNHPRGGEAKYLENAVKHRSAGMLKRLGDFIKRLVERGVDSEPQPIGNTFPVVRPQPKRPKKQKVQARSKATPVKRQKPKRKG